MRNEQLIIEAYIHHKGIWPSDLISGVMYWKGARVTIKDFTNYGLFAIGNIE